MMVSLLSPWSTSTGATLKSLITGRPLDTEMVLSLAIEIADALDAAHSGGHPSPGHQACELFVTERGHAKVLDFSLAKLAPARRATDGTETDNQQRCTPRSI